MLTNHQGIGMSFSYFYQQLFSSSHPSNIDQCLSHLHSIISDSMNISLMADFSKKEIKEALFQMNRLGAPSTYRFPFFFFQKNWHDVSKDVCRFVSARFVSAISKLQIFLERFNETFITLIIKVKSAKRVGEFRLISLCNVIYKIVAKSLANRLKKFLPSLISPQQCAFVLGRLISNNLFHMRFFTLQQQELK